MNDRILRIDLNQPFDFREAMLSQADRSRLARGATVKQLFQSEPERVVVTDFRLREISIRLRTINNASDSMASLPDGTHLTEASIYGSRERHYLLGPYRAVRDLMAGKLQDHSPYDIDDGPTKAATAFIENALKGLDKYIDELSVHFRVQGVRLDALLSSRHNSPLSLAIPRRINLPPLDGVEFGRMVQIDRDERELLNMARSRIEALREQIPQPPKSPAPPRNWWEPMPPLESYDYYREGAAASMGVAVRQILVELEERVFAPG